MGKMVSMRAYLTKLRDEAAIYIKPGYEDSAASASEKHPTITFSADALLSRKRTKVERTRFREMRHHRQKSAAPPPPAPTDASRIPCRARCRAIRSAMAATPAERLTRTDSLPLRHLQNQARRKRSASAKLPKIRCRLHPRVRQKTQARCRRRWPRMPNRIIHWRLPRS